MSMEDRHAETRNDEDHNLARLLRSTQREAEICAGYALEAEAADAKRLAGFFQEVQTMHESVIEKAEAILVKEARVKLKVVPVRVDPAPGDVSPLSSRSARHIWRSVQTISPAIRALSLLVVYIEFVRVEAVAAVYGDG